MHINNPKDNFAFFIENVDAVGTAFNNQEVRNIFEFVTVNQYVAATPVGASWVAKGSETKVPHYLVNSKTSVVSFL